MSNTTTKPKIRHSALDKLDACPCFEGAPPKGGYAERGTKIDAAVRAAYRGDIALLGALDDKDRDAAYWALAQLQRLAKDAPVETREEELKMHTPHIEHVGTADALCPAQNWLADLKTGQKYNYRAQMAAYALACMEKHFAETWAAHIIYCDQREIVTHEFTREEALATVERIVNAARDPAREPSACDYCGWCAKQDTCPAVVKPAERAVAVAGETGSKEASLSAIRERILATPESIGRFLADAAIFNKQIVDEVKKEARARLSVNPDAVPGWQLTNVKGKETFPHIAIVRVAAASKCGLDSVVLAMGGTMPGNAFRDWAVSLGQPVDEALAVTGAETTQLRQSAAKKTKKENK